jgi:hypothetical protein
VPQYIYYKNIGEEIVYYTTADSTGLRTPFWRPTQVPPTGTTGTTQVPAAKWVRIDWAQHLTATFADVDGTGSKPFWQAMAFYFVSGKSELFPFDAATIASYQGKLQQNPGY